MPAPSPIAAAVARFAWRPSRTAKLDSRTATRSGPAAMTLIEILVVLALLVVIGSIVVPAFTGSFATVRLRRAGDQVLAAWSRARAAAIETGEVRQFRYEPDSGTFVTEPWTAEEATGASTAPQRRGATPSAASSSAASTPATSTGSGASAAASQPAVNLTSEESTLPEEIVFHRGEHAVENVPSGEQQVQSLQAANDSRSAPILFFPDGTTSAASITLTNGKGQFLRATLRGLTGVGRASGVMTREELQQAERRR